MSEADYFEQFTGDEPAPMPKWIVRDSAGYIKGRYEDYQEASRSIVLYGEGRFNSYEIILEYPGVFCGLEFPWQGFSR